MGIINVYNTISNEHSSLHANGKLKDVLPEVDFSHSIILKAGSRVNKEYEVTEEDVLYIRKVPGSTAVMAVIALVSAVVAIGVGVGSALYAKKQSEEAKKQMEKAQRDANNLAQQAQQLPFIRGAKNKNALGNPVQFPMGSVYNTPYNLTNGFYSIDGTDGCNSYYNAAFSLGFGKQKITEMLLGEDSICVDSNGISEGIHNFNTESLYYDSNLSNEVEVAYPGTDLTIPNCNQKVSSTYLGAELKHDYGQDAEPVTFQCANHAKKVQVCIQFSCLRSYDSDGGNWTNRTAIVIPYWSNGAKDQNGKLIWNQFNFEGVADNTFTRNTNRTIRFVATKEFSAAESYGKTISIKVEKTTPKAESGSQEDCAVLWYQTFCYDPKKSTSSNLVDAELLYTKLRNLTTRVAYRIQSGSNTDSIIDELHCMSQNSARVWNGTVWSTEKQPTRNPASWILELMTSDIHEPSRIGLSEINLNSLGEVYTYCEQNNFYTDGIITNSEKKLNVITKICQSINVDMIINQSGLYEFVIDKAETVPVCLLNAENIRSVTFSKDMSRKTDGTKVTFTNRDTWSTDTFYAMLDGGDYDYTQDTVEALSMEYVTEYQHAYKMAQRKQRQSQLMPLEVKADVGLEGDYYPLYSLVKAQLPQLLIGYNSSVITGFIKNNDEEITGITISDAVIFEAGNSYGVTIQATSDNGKRIISAEVTGTGKTRTLLFTQPLTTDLVMPEVGNHLSFGPYGSETKLMKIYGIEPNDNSGYTLTLREYNEEVYSYGGTIPEYKSNITLRQKPSNAVTIDDLNRVRQDMNVLEETLINAYQMISFPVVVDADNKSFIIEVNNDGHTTTTTTLRTRISCKQGDEDRNFVIGAIDLPGGWTSTVENDLVSFFIGADVTVRSGTIKIPVIYRPSVAYTPYEDEEGNLYVDENNNVYMEEELAGQSYTYDVYVTYMSYGNAINLGVLKYLEDIPEAASINDYFTWGGDNNAATDLTMDGVLKKARTYKYIGTSKAWKYETDDDITHMYFSFGDILGIADSDLINNNSIAWQYLDHLTANSIFVQMISSNQAFIKALVASTAFIDTLKAETGLFTDVFIKGTGYLKDVEIAGNSLFKGQIKSGPLELLDESPTSASITINQGQDLYALENDFTRYNSYEYTGIYGSVTFTKCLFEVVNNFQPERKVGYNQFNPNTGRIEWVVATVPAVFQYDVVLKLYNGSNLVYNNTKQNNPSLSNYTPIYTADYQMTINYKQSSGSKTFKLKGLPDTQPSEPGIVWNNHGTLCIS